MNDRVRINNDDQVVYLCDIQFRKVVIEYGNVGDNALNQRLLAAWKQ